MDFSPIERPPESFQAPVSDAEIVAMCKRVLGKDTAVRAAVELGLGSYNNTYQVDVGGTEPLILRVAPSRARQFVSEREWMRNEYATAPFLAGVAALIPRMLGVDFTHEVVDRDYMIQTVLPGVPGAEALSTYDRSLWPRFYGQLAAIARRIHSVTGDYFGSVAAPKFRHWGDALVASLDEARSDLDRCSLPTEDVRELTGHVGQHRAAFDEVRRPHLLHGDLWTSNVMLERGSKEPNIVGIFDSERASWGDPMADWIIYRADARKSAVERDAFWQAYGGRGDGANAGLRQQVYRARHLVAVRLESFRMQDTAGIEETYSELETILQPLR